jgi:hypothetical protein
MLWTVLHGLLRIMLPAVLRTVLNAMLRTMRKSAPPPSAGSQVCAMRTAMGKLLARLLSRRQTGRVAESVMAQPCEGADRPDVRPPRSRMPRKRPLDRSFAKFDFGGCAVGLTKTNGRYGAGEKQHVSHRQHATLQSTLCDSITRPPSLRRKWVIFVSKM